VGEEAGEWEWHLIGSAASWIEDEGEGKCQRMCMCMCMCSARRTTTTAR
jgi:hypothetical protein